MAVLSQLDAVDSQRIVREHSLGLLLNVEPVAAGSVNTNYIITTSTGRFFLRIYEEQGVDGVAHEWALLEHLRNASIQVPRRVGGKKPGEVLVHGKPMGLFDVVAGEELRQPRVRREHCFQVGDVLAAVHRACASISASRKSRFTRERMLERLDGIVASDPELSKVVPPLPEGEGRGEGSLKGESELFKVVLGLRDTLFSLSTYDTADFATGVIHGDLFRDNVRWEQDRILCVLDWESAGSGFLAYDVAVAILAWCYGTSFEWSLAQEVVEGYLNRATDARQDLERALYPMMRLAAARFTTTRITDYHLRTHAIGDRVIKDYRRFWQRLCELDRLGQDEVMARLFKRL